jgi:hypothetical protein
MSSKHTIEPWSFMIRMCGIHHRWDEDEGIYVPEMEEHEVDLNVSVSIGVAT